MMTARKYSPAETRKKLAAWCDRKERTHWEAREKLATWGVPHSERESLIAEMIEKNYINENRYAMAFTSDRFRFNCWGMEKIKQALKLKGISAVNITMALESLPVMEVSKTIRDLISKQSAQTRGRNAYQKKARIARIIIGKGFPPNEVWDQLNELLKD